MNIPPENLKKMLLNSGLISESDFESAQKEAKRTEKNLEDILISRGFLNQDYYAEILATYFNVPRVKLIGSQISSEVLKIIPEDVARVKGVVVFDKDDKTIKVAMRDPANLEIIEFLEKYTGYLVKPYLALNEDLQAVFSQYGKIVSLDFQRVIEENIKESLKIKGVDPAKAALEFPIIAISDSLISYAASLNASDIHLEASSDELIVRFRIDGVLREILRLSKEIHPALIARIKILANLQIDEHNKPQDGRFKYKYTDTIFDIRVAIMPTMHGEKIEMRLLTGSVKPMSFQELGMLEETIKLIESNIIKTNGMILVTGPTGCGKTTTLYAILNKLNRPEVNIVTIEDPIEYELKYVNQTQVNPRAGIDFANGLRAILRQDPNIIMVGEIRDNETAEIAVHAALTGHLVLSTLHTNDATTSVPRLIDMGVPPFLVAATINVAIAQRLLRRICRDCIESFQLDEGIRKAIKEQFALIKGENKGREFIPTQLYRGKGCKSCGFTGYRGRLAIYEVFNVDEDIRVYIQRTDFSLDGLKKLAFSKGMKTMLEDGLAKAELGLTTVEEVLRALRE